MPNDSPVSAEQGTSVFVDVLDREEALVVRPKGPALGQREAPIVAEETLKRINGFPRKLRFVALDLTQVEMMASMGVGFCIDCRNQAKARRAKTIIYGLNRELRELFRMMKIERLFILVHSEEDLEKAIGR